VPAVGAQLARQRDALAVVARLALARNGEAAVGPLQSGELLRAPGELRSAVEAERQRTARGEAALAAAQ